MKITIVTVSTSVLSQLSRLHMELESSYPGAFDLRLFYLARKAGETSLRRMESALVESDAALIDLMGSAKEDVVRVHGALSRCPGCVIPIGSSGRQFLRLGSLTAESIKSSMKKGGRKGPAGQSAMKKMGSMAEKLGKVIPGKMRDLGNLSRITKYFHLADRENLRNMLFLLAREYGGNSALPKPEEPRDVPDVGIRELRSLRYYESYESYRNDFPVDSDKPVLALFSYGHTYPNDTAGPLADLAEKIESFASILPLAFSSPLEGKSDQLRSFLFDRNGKCRVDGVLNLMSFRLGSGPMGGNSQEAVHFLKEMGVPYFHPFFMSRREEAEWLNCTQGVNSSEFLLSVMLPELDGAIVSMPIGAMGPPDHDKKLDVELQELKLIDERVDTFLLRLRNYLLLRRKPAAEKRIALIGYNYPPGEDNVFGASFLDTFLSMERILKQLADAGYNVELKTAAELANSFMNRGLCNMANYHDPPEEMIYYDAGAYRTRMEGPTPYRELCLCHGEAPGEVMGDQDGDRFLIPGLLLGNVFIGIQPSRRSGGSDSKSYHDKDSLPHHQYLAFYQWIEKEFQADAVVHVGTHGTLEFTPGKECGMSGSCFPDILAGTIPHVYLYYNGNPAEAMIAKRRSHALLISYQPPEYQPADLYGEYEKLQILINEYRESARLSPVRSDDILEDIKRMARELSMPDELEPLEDELYRMKRSLIPKGLHIFGESYTSKEMEHYLKGLLRYERDGSESLARIAAESLGIDYDQAMENQDPAALGRIDHRFEELFGLRDGFWNGTSLQLQEGELQLTPPLKKRLETLFREADSIAILGSKAREMPALLSALRGEYISARMAGDIYRNPEVLPGGYNLYQFDPRLVPSATALRRGSAVAALTLNRYVKEEGELPESTALILWGLETSRTQGESVGQILAYLGARPIKKRNVWDSGFELIPLHELGRKRVDVLIHICGFFRDMFSNIIEDLNKLFDQLAEVDEPEEMNPFKAHCRIRLDMLLDQGFPREEAIELSRARIFGPEEGEYGTGLTNMVNSRRWETEEELGGEFINKLRHVYSRNARGKKIDGLLESNLEAVELVSQLRSNHEYEITDLDHYYEFVGGLAKSVETVRGKKARLYISDTTGEAVRTDSINESINRGIRSRVLNPKWIDSMLEHKFHGAQHIADRFENVLGLAATTGAVEDHIYQNLFSTYIEDEVMQQRMRENNPYAYTAILERMMEYRNRGYWNADKKELAILQELILQLDGDIEGQEE